MEKNKTTWEERFWLFWGLAPKGSLKYKKGVDTLAFISQERKEWEDQLKSSITNSITHEKKITKSMDRK